MLKMVTQVLIHRWGVTISKKMRTMRHYVAFGNNRVFGIVTYRMVCVFDEDPIRMIVCSAYNLLHQQNCWLTSRAAFNLIDTFRAHYHLSPCADDVPDCEESGEGARSVPKHTTVYYCALRTNDCESIGAANQTFGGGCKQRALSPKIRIQHSQSRKCQLVSHESQLRNKYRALRSFFPSFSQIWGREWLSFLHQSSQSTINNGTVPAVD